MPSGAGRRKSAAASATPRWTSNQVTGAETFTAASLEAAHEYVRAQELQWAGRYEEAISGYQKAVEARSIDLGRAYAGLGAVSSSLGRRQEAEGYFKEALRSCSTG